MDLKNEDVLDMNSNNVTLVMSGNQNSELNNDTDLEFYDLKLNKTGGASVTLNSDVLIENNIDMTGGVLDLNGYTVSLFGLVMNEDFNNYIMGASGKIEVITNLNNPAAVNPGNLGIEITSGQNLGQVVVRRSHQIQTAANGNQSIQRYFDINPANNSGLDATLRMYYFDHELNGLSENGLGLYRSEDNGSTWEWYGFDILNAAENYVELNNIDAFSRWTIGNETNNPLPVELHYFRGETLADYNLLEWESLSEENVDHYQVEKLLDDDWVEIGRVEAAHFSTEAKQYYFEDFAVQKDNYYRLRMLDYDGSFEWSSVVYLQGRRFDDVIFDVYPNPVQETLLFQIGEATTLESFELINASGKTLGELTLQNNRLDVSGLPAGLYFIRAQIDNELYVKNFVKQ